MSEVSERYGRIADGFTARLKGVGDDQWDEPTPCTEWSVRDLVVHVIDTHGRVVSMVTGAEPRTADAGADLLPQWSTATGAVVDSLDDPERAAAIVGGSFGEQPFESLVDRLLCADTLFHTWDLARATGQDDRLDPEGVERTMGFLEPVDDAIRRPGGFAPKIAAAPGAGPQTRLLNFAGRADD